MNRRPPSINIDEAVLNEFDKDEWREIAKKLRPDWTEQEFEAAWADFIKLKRQKEAH